MVTLAEPTFTQGTYTGLRVSPPSRTGTRMTTDFHSAAQSGLATRRATSALYTGRIGQKVIFLPPFKLQSVALHPQGLNLSQATPWGVTLPLTVEKEVFPEPQTPLDNPRGPLLQGATNTLRVE